MLVVLKLKNKDVDKALKETMDKMGGRDQLMEPLKT